MHAWFRILSWDELPDEHLRINGAAMAAVAAFCKNFLRETEKVWGFINSGIRCFVDIYLKTLYQI
jgi:hypothetical protein